MKRLSNSTTSGLTLNRRGFVKSAGAALTVTFLVGCGALPVIPKRPKPELADATGWIRHEQGRYTLYIPRVEMGQNITTALKQIACQELGVDWQVLTVALPSTTQIARVRATVGSESIKDFALPLAQACASLREALKAGRGVQAQLDRVWPALELLAFKKGGPFVGQRAALEQADAIVRGLPLYCADVRRPGMRYGRVLRAPVSPELTSSPQSFNEAAARAVPGFVALVQDKLLRQGLSEGVGIVAHTPGALDRIEAALAVVWKIDGQFDQGTLDQALDIDGRISASPRRDNVLHKEDMSTAAPWDVDLRIDVPLAAHAAIEPRSATAEFAPDGSLQLWVGTQDVFYQRDVVAKRMGLSEDTITAHSHRVGGAFGGKTICTVELEAAVLARAANVPVKVQWSRAQEFRQGFHRPPSSHRIRARLAGGRLQDWSHDFASSHILFTNAVLPAWLQRLTDFVGDDGVARGAQSPYKTVAKRVGFDLVRLPIYTGPWRGLGAGPNVFAIESAIDECARAAKVDPVQFRLDHIDDPRLARCLSRAAQAAAWGTKSAVAATTGIFRARGVACGIYKAMSYAAVVADVEVNKLTGAVRVTRLLCAHDCGLVVNPDQVRAQCEGNLVWGLGMMLVERLPVGQSAVAATTFADSPIPRMSDVPPMEMVLIDEGEAPTGAGETAIVAAGAAIANAVRAATGLRILTLPLRAQDMLAHLRSNRLT
jgi:isoquinoline 1-oxidoreductase subunit beta